MANLVLALQAGPHGPAAAGPDFSRDCVISWGSTPNVADFMKAQGSVHEINHHDQVLMSNAPA
jgi:hypothetical protein